ncbi:type II toxin-antitoxin system RelE/ParE family toxin [Luteibacter anthropi]|nr:type II toxin-antitoxin system RelE/ParE family toxin [Luteibacter anthropi]
MRETPVFTRLITELVDDDNYAAFQQWLAQHPEAGDVIQNTGGLRKIRLACGGQGKRSGARVIYYHFVRRSHIAMLLVYPKNAMDDLTESQKKSLKHLIDTWR